MRWFEQRPEAIAELEAILRRDYPTLHVFNSDNVVTVRGTYAVRDAGVVIDRYSLALTLPDEYPNELLDVKEIDGRIPNSLDRHVFPSGALCLGVREELWLTMGGDFSVPRVLDADSDEAGHAFQSEAGRYSELMPARYSDAKPAT